MTIELHAVVTREPCFFIRMLAKHIGVELELKALNYDKEGRLPAEYAKISRLLKVPAIIDDGFILYESTAICYYLLNKYAPVSPLYPKEVEKRARSRPDLVHSVKLRANLLHPSTSEAVLSRGKS
ncbi:glutathione S-transferase 1-like [Rhipicephalus sanguineus]|uniref:glutathione S-transferase 1-like n=1 Tax=Rhipicephalus sanguineus TaxID=34632 RepID=UPI001895F312|nr:glutathione S-transferase 1-like [Rhipicephalus sanguineus]